MGRNVNLALGMDKIGPRMLTVLHMFGPACLTFSVICRVLGGYPWHTEGVAVFFPVFSNDSQDYEAHLKNKITDLLLKPVNSIFSTNLMSYNSKTCDCNLACVSVL